VVAVDLIEGNCQYLPEALWGKGKGLLGHPPRPVALNSPFRSYLAPFPVDLRLPSPALDHLCVPLLAAGASSAYQPFPSPVSLVPHPYKTAANVGASSTSVTQSPPTDERPACCPYYPSSRCRRGCNGSDTRQRNAVFAENLGEGRPVDNLHRKPSLYPLSYRPVTAGNRRGWGRKCGDPSTTRRLTAGD
jgi:hypothetical protein